MDKSPSKLDSEIVVAWTGSTSFVGSQPESGEFYDGSANKCEMIKEELGVNLS